MIVIVISLAAVRARGTWIHFTLGGYGFGLGGHRGRTVLDLVTLTAPGSPTVGSACGDGCGYGNGRGNGCGRGDL
jgi:hypothetical protein